MRNLFKTITLVVCYPVCIIYYLISFLLFDNACVACPYGAYACENCKLKDKQAHLRGE